MKIQPDGFLAELAYENEKDVPENINIFILILRLAFGMICFIETLILLIILAMGSFFFAKHPDMRGPNSPIFSDFMPYSRWPRIYGHRVWPIIAFVPVVLFCIYRLI